MLYLDADQQMKFRYIVVMAHNRNVQATKALENGHTIDIYGWKALRNILFLENEFVVKTIVEILSQKLQ